MLNNQIDMDMLHTPARCKDIYILQPECDVVKVCIPTPDKNSWVPQIYTGGAATKTSYGGMPLLPPFHDTDRVAPLRTNFSALMTQV